jgi:hypothetical protein
MKYIFTGKDGQYFKKQALYLSRKVQQDIDNVAKNAKLLFKYKYYILKMR